MLFLNLTQAKLAVAPPAIPPIALPTTGKMPVPINVPLAATAVIKGILTGNNIELS